MQPEILELRGLKLSLSTVNWKNTVTTIPQNNAQDEYIWNFSIRAETLARGGIRISSLAFTLKLPFSSFLSNISGENHIPQPHTGIQYNLMGTPQQPRGGFRVHGQPLGEVYYSAEDYFNRNLNNKFAYNYHTNTIIWLNDSRAGYPVLYEIPLPYSKDTLIKMIRGELTSRPPLPTVEFKAAYRLPDPAKFKSQLGLTAPQDPLWFSQIYYDGINRRYFLILTTRRLYRGRRVISGRSSFHPTRDVGHFMFGGWTSIPEEGWRPLVNGGYSGEAVSITNVNRVSEIIIPTAGSLNKHPITKDQALAGYSYTLAFDERRQLFIHVDIVREIVMEFPNLSLFPSNIMYLSDLITPNPLATTGLLNAPLDFFDLTVSNPGIRGIIYLDRVTYQFILYSDGLTFRFSEGKDQLLSKSGTTGDLASQVRNSPLLYFSPIGLEIDLKMFLSDKSRNTTPIPVKSLYIGNKQATNRHIEGD